MARRGAVTRVRILTAIFMKAILTDDYIDYISVTLQILLVVVFGSSGRLYCITVLGSV